RESMRDFLRRWLVEFSTFLVFIAVVLASLTYLLRRDLALVAKYGWIDEGMMLEEAEAIFGQPGLDFPRAHTGAPWPGGARSWLGRNIEVLVGLDGNGRIRAKWCFYRRPTLFEHLSVRWENTSRWLDF